MQAQSVNTNVQNITVSQSLAAVQTLLKAGLGCITYLRDLLPVDNFNESHFVSSEDAMPSLSSNADNLVDKKLKRNISAFKIMTVTRGYTEEADKLLNYLEFGIFDALKKQYLRSFIFAIYLDSKDPNNIVEAYTFNFTYHSVPGTDTVLPIMSFNDGSGKPSHRRSDPITEAARRGKPPTLGEVKKSVKSLLRRLVNATTQMDALPKRRFATFKLFYYDNTPADYEPPNFHPGDAVKDRWFFTTHGKEEAPEKWSLGGLETGYHGVNINVTSVAGFLPPSHEDNDATFAGITSRPPGLPSAVPSLTPAQEAALRARQIDVQMKDAAVRNVVWSVEGDEEDPDAEGEPDDGYVLTANGTYEKQTAVGDSLPAPIGIRNQDGLVVPIPFENGGGDGQARYAREDGSDAVMDVDPVTQSEVLFEGTSEPVPTRVGDLIQNLANATNVMLDQTQQICPTQDLEDRTLPQFSSRHGSPVPIAITDAFASINIASGIDHSAAEFRHDIDIDTQILRNVAMCARTTYSQSRGQSDDISSVNTPTRLPAIMEEDQIESFPVDDAYAYNATEDIMETQEPRDIPAQSAENLVDNGLKCECGVSIEDECTFCEGGCGNWYHIWCMGFHSTSDKRIPARFVCFDCRVHADLNWDLIKVDLYPKMISKFKDLALFRRAIKVAEVYKPSNFARFSKLIGCDSVVARQLFKRLELEDFLSIETKITDELGMLETATRSLRSKAKQKGKQRKTMQKAKYTFNSLSRHTEAYNNYFNPDPAVENRVLGLSDLKSSFKALRRHLVPGNTENAASVAAALPPHSLPPSDFVNESQTQADSQPTAVFGTGTRGRCANDLTAKRKTTSRENINRRPSKKVKISMVSAVDLGD